MEIKNFKVVSQEISETQQGEVKGNTVVLSFNYEKGQLPMYVGFSVVRGKAGDKNYTGQTFLSGSIGIDLIETKFHEKKKRGDFALVNELLSLCDEIINQETTETDETENSSK